MGSLTTRGALLTKWRRALFYTWIIAAIVAAAAAMIGGPLVSTDGVDGTRFIALVSPAAMAVFLVSGLIWLALLVFSHRSRYTHEPPPG